ncbi:LppU/SCO3897 family protein [Tsukamurella ocularis]|uniref:LppU/SCO3897 family protein n=1 Tax=Tsukamurella ocularis TaxID=1970234 RepID=UPI004044ACE6
MHKRRTKTFISCVAVVALSALSTACSPGEGSSPSTSQAAAASSSSAKSGLDDVYSLTDAAGWSSTQAFGGVSVGDCVAIVTADSVTKVTKENCGAQSTYRVFQTTNSAQQCPSDADRVAFENSPTGSGALCLDIDWRPGKCYQKDGQAVLPRVAECTKGKSARLVAVATGDSGKESCSDQRNVVILHPVRDFYQCVAFM